MQSPTQLELYLEEVRRHLNLDPERSGPIIRELRSHLLERAEDGEDSGLSGEEALARSIDSFGRPRALARLLYESHRQTSWAELGVSALPHLMIAFLFAIGGWTNWVLAPLILMPMVLVTLYGWWQGKPGWLYPWAGWALVPLAIGAYWALPVFNQIYRLLTSSGPAPDSWAVAGLLAYLAVASWILVSTTVRVAKRNWTLASLMLLPMPVMITWLVLQERAGGLFDGQTLSLHQLDGTMSLINITLGFTTVGFLMIRESKLKVFGLMAVTFFAVTALLRASQADLELTTMAVLAAVVSALLLTPALIESAADMIETRRRGARAG